MLVLLIRFFVFEIFWCFFLFRRRIACALNGKERKKKTKERKKEERINERMGHEYVRLLCECVYRVPNKQKCYGMLFQSEPRHSQKIINVLKERKKKHSTTEQNEMKCNVMKWNPFVCVKYQLFVVGEYEILVSVFLGVVENIFLFGLTIAIFTPLHPFARFLFSLVAIVLPRLFLPSSPRLSQKYTNGKYRHKCVCTYSLVFPCLSSSQKSGLHLLLLFCVCFVFMCFYFFRERDEHRLASVPLSYRLLV